jgi:hypothetical protein
MNLYIMFISKRQNSTLVPPLTGITPTTVYLKQDTSIINPTFVIEGDSLNLNVNYCYCPDTGRYYFIRDIICRHDKIYDLVCEIDVLASFKAQILASSAFIMYAASGSTIIPDDRMTTTKNFTVTHADAAFPAAVGGNNYFISVTGNNGVETFYVLRSDIATMFDALNFDTITVTQGSSTEETLKNVGDAMGLCFEQCFTQGTVMNNIRSAYVLPFPPDEECLGTPKNIHCGFYDTNVEGEPLVEAIFSQAIVLTIPWSVEDWRRLSPYSVVAVYLPYFGVISLDSNSLINSSYVTVKYSICYYSGDLSYSIETEQNRIIATGKCNVAAPWGVGSSAGGGSVINNAIGMASADIAQIGGILGKIPLVGKFIEGASNTVTGVTQSFVKPASTEGGLGGFSDSGLDLRLHCWVMTKEFSDTQSNFATLCGYPVMAVGSLAGRTGYLQTNGFEMAGSATSQERNIINALLDSGIFIE